MRSKFLIGGLRPGRGFAHLFHWSLVIILPVLMFILVRLHFEGVALALVILSKWRMFAVRPHHWMAHIRTNAVDIIVGVSILAYMGHSEALGSQLIWLALYELWLLFIKPGSSVLIVSLQAVIAQFLGLSSIFLAFPEAQLVIYLIGFWLVTYFSARHFFGSFEEAQAKLLSSVWAFFGAGLMWVLGHWLLFIGPVAQPAVLLSVLGYGLAGLYYLDETDRLSALMRRQIIVVMFAIVFVMIVFSNWGDKALA